MEKREGTLVESHLLSLRALHAELASADDIDELLRVIHRPGWTTPAEMAFLIAGLESVIAQTKQLTFFRQKLVAAARAVGVKAVG